MKLSPEEKKYRKVCKLIGVHSLTELRFVTRLSLIMAKGVGKKTIQYTAEWLKVHKLSYGKYNLKDYLANRSEIWEKETGFIVFKYKIRSVFPGLGLGVEWAIGSFQPDPLNFTQDGIPRISFKGLTTSEAKALISDHDLELAYEDEEGEIYDFPDGRFFKHFGHGSADLSRAHCIRLAGGDDDE